MVEDYAIKSKISRYKTLAKIAGSLKRINGAKKTTASELAFLNWGTRDSALICRWLYEVVGTLTYPEEKSWHKYRFDGHEHERGTGIIKIPKKALAPDLAMDRQHEIVIRRPREPMVASIDLLDKWFVPGSTQRGGQPCEATISVWGLQRKEKASRHFDLEVYGSNYAKVKKFTPKSPMPAQLEAIKNPTVLYRLVQAMPTDGTKLIKWDGHVTTDKGILGKKGNKQRHVNVLFSPYTYVTRVAKDEAASQDARIALKAFWPRVAAGVADYRFLDIEWKVSGCGKRLKHGQLLIFDRTDRVIFRKPLEKEELESKESFHSFTWDGEAFQWDKRRKRVKLGRRRGRKYIKTVTIHERDAPFRVQVQGHSDEYEASPIALAAMQTEVRLFVHPSASQYSGKHAPLNPNSLNFRLADPLTEKWRDNAISAKKACDGIAADTKSIPRVKKKLRMARKMVAHQKKQVEELKSSGATGKGSGLPRHQRYLQECEASRDKHLRQLSVLEKRLKTQKAALNVAEETLSWSQRAKYHLSSAGLHPGAMHLPISSDTETKRVLKQLQRAVPKRNVNPDKKYFMPLDVTGTTANDREDPTVQVLRELPANWRPTFGNASLNNLTPTQAEALFNENTIPAPTKTASRKSKRRAAKPKQGQMILWLDDPLTQYVDMKARKRHKEGTPPKKSDSARYAEGYGITRPRVPLQVDIPLRPRDTKGRGLLAPATESLCNDATREATGFLRVDFSFVDLGEDLSAIDVTAKTLMLDEKGKIIRDSEGNGYKSGIYDKRYVRSRAWMHALFGTAALKSRFNNCPDFYGGLRPVPVENGTPNIKKTEHKDYTAPVATTKNGHLYPWPAMKASEHRTIYVYSHDDLGDPGVTVEPLARGRAGVYMRPSTIAGDGYCYSAKIRMDWDWAEDAPHPNADILAYRYGFESEPGSPAATSAGIRLWRRVPFKGHLKWSKTDPDWKVVDQLNKYYAPAFVHFVSEKPLQWGSKTKHAQKPKPGQRPEVTLTPNDLTGWAKPFLENYLHNYLGQPSAVKAHGGRKKTIGWYAKLEKEQIVDSDYAWPFSKEPRLALQLLRRPGTTLANFETKHRYIDLAITAFQKSLQLRKKYDRGKHTTGKEKGNYKDGGRPFADFLFEIFEKETGIFAGVLTTTFTLMPPLELEEYICSSNKCRSTIVVLQNNATPAQKKERPKCKVEGCKGHSGPKTPRKTAFWSNFGLPAWGGGHRFSSVPGIWMPASRYEEGAPLWAHEYGHALGLAHSAGHETTVPNSSRPHPGGSVDTEHDCVHNDPTNKKNIWFRSSPARTCGRENWPPVKDGKLYRRRLVEPDGWGHHSERWDTYCMMSYSLPRENLYFCGKCLLQLRGWEKVTKLDNPDKKVRDR